MTIVDAIVLGIVEGITEFLPVSSTGHLILTAWLLGLGDSADEKAAVDAFNVVIQGGAILAVAGLYWPRVRSMILGLVGRDVRGLSLFLKLCVAFLPAGILGPLFDDAIEARLFRPGPVISALALGGILLIVLKPWQTRILRDEREGIARRRGIDDLSFRDCLLIGILQCVAMWPGTSRSMMTIVGGLLVGLSPVAAAEFSFLLGLPTLGGACLYTLFKEYRDHGTDTVAVLGGALPVTIGILTAMVAAAIAVKWLVGFLGRNSMALFGWWRIVLAAGLGAAIASGAITLEVATDAQGSEGNPTSGGSSGASSP
jgi:undecaprenyl-diphosphatase